MDEKKGTTWDDAGTVVWFDDPEEGHRTYATIEPWWYEGQIVPENAWVARHFDRSSLDDGWKLTAVWVDAPATPALGDIERERVVLAASSAVKEGPQRRPRPVRFGHSANSPEGLQTLIRQVGEGLMRAEGRVFNGTEVKTNDDNLRIAVYDTMAWLRTLDEIFDRAWTSAARNRREDVSVMVDRTVVRLQTSGSSLTVFDEAYASRLSSSEPYGDWALAMLPGNVTRAELLGFRWLAGKLLHHGPRQCTELVQWAPGEPPRWKWIDASHIVPEAATEPAKLKPQREAYRRAVEGRDVLGMMGFNEVALAGEKFFRRLYAQEWEPPPLRW